jgi:hypothetical protein
VQLVSGRISPLLWVFGGRARLLLPAGLWDRLDAEQQQTLLIHELAHLRRGDQWVRRLEILVAGLYWWHPVVWWALRELREAEEQCCDAWVVWALPRAGRAYATALVETVDFLSEARTALPAAASGMGQVHDLRRRITMIMRGTTPRTLSTAGFLAVLGLGALLLPWLPTWAQQPRQEDRDRDKVVAQRQPRPEGEDELGRQRQEVERFGAEVKRLHDQLQQMTERLQAAQEDLRRKELALARAQRSRLVVEDERRFDVRQETPRDLARRLSDVERKLDALLAEVQGLRRELRRGQEAPRGGRPGGPGGGGPPEAPRSPQGDAYPRLPEAPRPALPANVRRPGEVGRASPPAVPDLPSPAPGGRFAPPDTARPVPPLAPGQPAPSRSPAPLPEPAPSGPPEDGARPSRA